MMHPGMMCYQETKSRISRRLRDLEDLGLLEILDQVLKTELFFFKQVSASLPKTSYFKMVDIWLLFCIGIIFFIIVFHAIIDNYLPDNDHMDITHHSTTFVKRVAPKDATDLPDFDDRAKRVKLVQKLILASKLLILMILVIFNVFYWGFILA